MSGLLLVLEALGALQQPPEPICVGSQRMGLGSQQVLSRMSGFSLCLEPPGA